MPYTGTPPNQVFERTDGTRTGNTVWEQADAASVDIVPDDHDTHDQDIAGGLNQVLMRNGGNTATANIPMGGNRLTDVGLAQTDNEYIRFDQARDGDHTFYPTVGGTANAITLTSAAGFSLSGYTEGMPAIFKATADNTGSTTVNVDGQGVVTVKRWDGTSDLLAGDIRIGAMVVLAHDGTNFQLHSSSSVPASADVLARIVPTGSVIWWSLPTIPGGWLKANGQTVTKSQYPELDAVYHADGYPYGSSDPNLGVGTFNLPPAAGRFLRVTDDGAGLDPDAASRTDRGDGTAGDNVGTLQDDENKQHDHPASSGNTEVSITDANADTQGDTGPVNVWRVTAGSLRGGTQAFSMGSHNHAITVDNAGGAESRPKNIYQFLIVLASPVTAAASTAGTVGLAYTFSSETADADPGSGHLRLNNATYSAVTEIYISDSDTFGAPQAARIDTWDDPSSTVRGGITITQTGAPSIQAYYQITGDTTTATGYRKLAVTHVNSNGTLADGRSISVEHDRTGDRGVAGLVNATSSTLLNIALGAQTYVLNEMDAAFALGQRVRASNDTGTQYNEGIVTAFTSPNLEVTADLINGTGTNDDWNLGVAGEPGAGTLDPDAIHVNVAGEIAGISEKTTPVAADLLVIEDSAAANAKRRVQIGNLPGGSGTGDVVGPASAVDNNFATFDGTTGKLIKDGGTPGALAFLATVGTSQIDNNAVTTDKIVNGAATNAKLADMLQATIKGRAAAAGTGDPTDLTPDQAQAILDTATAPYAKSSGSNAWLKGQRKGIVAAALTSTTYDFSGQTLDTSLDWDLGTAFTVARVLNTIPAGSLTNDQSQAGEITGRTGAGGSLTFAAGWEFPGGTAPTVGASEEFTLYYRASKIGAAAVKYRLLAINSWS